MSKTVGQSTRGAVKLARDDWSGQKFVIKMNHRNVASSGGSAAEKETLQNPQGDKRKTRLEVALTMHLHHPNICRLLESVMDEQYHFMVFPYIKGQTLLDYVISNGRLKEREARKIARQVGSALQYLHLNNVVHRDEWSAVTLHPVSSVSRASDLKLEHILLTLKGDVKLIGFGLSTLFHPKHKLTEACGTHYFPAPEMLQGLSYTGPEIDVWCFGIVIYTVVCGRIPFDHDNMPALYDTILKKEPKYPGFLAADCRDMISSMLLKDSANRASMHDVVSHPWMMQGQAKSSTCADDPSRRFLRAHDVESDVISNMTSFGLGSSADIDQQLREIINGQDYQDWMLQIENERRAEIEARSRSPFTFWGMNLDDRSLVPPLRELVTDLFRSLRSHPTNLSLTAPSTNFARKLSSVKLESASWAIPTWGFHPLVSVYHLVEERMEQEMAK